ncbi:MAG: DUF1992 domain-containing protein [Chloroflexi bacterium]|nr:DUF1992 domain-containing protein [Chloroflexota bacterium]
MQNKRRGIEEIIQQAIEAGEFDDLPGKGKPLDLDENPFIDPEWRLAYNMLKQNNFAPEWVEARQEIEEPLAAARAALARSWTWRWDVLNETQPEALVQAEWEKAISRFSKTVDELNQKIADYNLQIPSQNFSRMRVYLEIELERLKGEAD